MINDSKPESTATGRGFGPLWAATAISSVGDGAYLAAAPLLAAALTRDPFSVSMVSVATLSPWFLVGPFAGALVDRMPRRTVIIASDMVRAVCLIVLVILIVSNRHSIAALAVAGFILTSAQSFHNSAAQALVPLLMGREKAQLASANSRLSTTESLGSGFVGPPVGSALFVAGPWVPFVADAASFVSSAALLNAVPEQPAPPHTGEGIVAALRTAIKWTVRQRPLVELAIQTAGGNLAANFVTAIFVLFATERLHLGAFGFGLLLTAQALGAMAGGWLAPKIAARMSFRAMLPSAQGARAIAYVTLALTTNPWIAAASMVVVGGSFTVGTVAIVSVRQQLVPDQMLGRVVSVFRLVGNGVAPIGAVLGGLLASKLSLVAPVMAAGILTACVAASALVPAFRTSGTNSKDGNTS